MAYTTVYSRINWENEPSINTPINATNLNAIDYAVYVHDQTLSNWDLTKANETDLLLCVKEITYDSDTGEFLFTWQNGTTLAVDLNIEKIPVSFSMSPQGVITMTTEDGTQYTADVGSLIKTYSFTDSSVIDFTVTTDADGNKTVTADIVDGSITGQKLQPNYLADCVSAKTDAETAEGLAEDSAEDSEAWANGTRNGVPVPNTDPAYHNNSKYWSEQSNPTSLVGLTDTDINNPTNGQTLIYNSTSQKWENQNGGSASLAGLSDVDLTAPANGQVLTYDLANQEWVNADIGASGGSNITVTTTEATLYGQNVTISDGVTTLTETFSPSGVALFEGVTMTGQLTIASGAFSTPLNVPYFGNYEPILSGFTATIAVTFPSSSTCTCGKTGETPQTAYVSPHTFSVHSTGTYTITATDGTHTKSDTVTITTDGQSESVTLTYVPDGSTVLPTDDIQIWLNCADIYDKTSYTTLSDILNDSTTLSALIADNNAVDYMVRSKSWASNAGLVPKMTSNTTPSGTVSASSTKYGAPWKAFADDWPTSVKYAWDSWAGDGTTNQWLSYAFTSAVKVSKLQIRACKEQGGSSACGVKNFKVQYSDDNSVWTDEGNSFVYQFTNGGTPTAQEFTLNDVGSHKYWRVYVIDTTSSAFIVSIANLQFFAYAGNRITEDSTAMSYIGLNNYCSNTLLADSDWLNAICNSTYFESVLNVKVPTMTDNTHPSGIASAGSSNSNAYKIFDGSITTTWEGSPTVSGTTSRTDNVKYKFNNSVRVVMIEVITHSTDSWSNGILAVSNDDSSYTDIATFDGSHTGVNYEKYYHRFVGIFANNTSNLYHRFTCTSYRVNGTTGNYGEPCIYELQFYGRVDV